jgi:hypothetical protein
MTDLSNRRYFQLTIQDLVRAQQLFHCDLATRQNVRATAVGRYRLRNDPQDTSPKTLLNTHVDRRKSFPCILVFVSEWLDDADLKADVFLKHRLPPYVTLPDRKSVPTCVLKIEVDRSFAPPLFQRLNFPTWLIGGGFPVVRRAQEEDRAGSLGCLVTDGANVFALTNRHVSGPPGSVIETFVNGKRQRIGKTASTQLLKVDIDKAFPGFEISKGWTQPMTYTNVDAGLIEVDDVNNWTAQIYGLGEIGEVFDLNADTLSLDLIGRRMRAFGAASGELTGEIQGFFYRYKSVGSFGYVSDIIIGPTAGKELTTIPGDSGTLWCLLPESKEGDQLPRPVAIQWGGHVFGGSTRYRIGLGTSLSTILRSLDVDLITEWNTGHNEYWGKVGHFKVAATACSIIDGPAKEIILSNAENISFTDRDIRDNKVSPKPRHFVPLADVADLVWRTTRRKDSANHFADMDEMATDGKFKGKTLLQLTANGGNIDPQTWVDFYESIGVDKGHMGALPFRVWQMFDDAVADLASGHIDRWVAAMGLMAHYVGDACQPLHVSFLHHGRPGHPEEERVHSVYETQMLDRNTLNLVQKVNAAAGNLRPLALVKNGHGAATAIVALMRRTVKTIDPIEVIDAYNETDGRDRLVHMWDVLGDRTALSIAQGAQTLAMLWDSAWIAGGAPQETPAISQDVLMSLYEDSTFAPAERLPTMVTMLTKQTAKLSIKPAPVEGKAAKLQVPTARKRPTRATR